MNTKRKMQHEGNSRGSKKEEDDAGSVRQLHHQLAVDLGSTNLKFECRLDCYFFLEEDWSPGRRGRGDSFVGVKYFLLGDVGDLYCSTGGINMAKGIDAGEMEAKRCEK